MGHEVRNDTEKLPGTSRSSRAWPRASIHRTITTRTRTPFPPAVDCQEQAIIDRSSAGVVRLMGAVAPSHGNGIRGANRAGNPG